MGSTPIWDPINKKASFGHSWEHNHRSVRVLCKLTNLIPNRPVRIYLASLAMICFSLQVRRVLGKEGRVRIGVQVLKALKLTKRKPPEEVSHQSLPDFLLRLQGLLLVGWHLRFQESAYNVG
jgi:hypothetical protein